MTRVKDKLRRLGVRPHKSRGQNFLVDPFVPKAICEFARLSPQQVSEQQQVVEIGPGLGALTEELRFIKKLHLIEIEPAFIGELRKRFPQAAIIHADVREVPFESIGEKLIVVGNLPYSLSTEIILHILKQHAVIERAVFLLQREFAARLAAGPGGRDYGRLSVMRSFFADASLGPVLDAQLFHPRPNVESQLIELVFFKTPMLSEVELAPVERLVKAAFGQRRKTILNSIKGSGLYDSELVAAALSQAGIAPMQRPETISPGVFAAIAKMLQQKSA